MNADIIIRNLSTKDCTPELLSEFNRYQEVNRCWRRENGEWALKDVSYIEQWNDEKKMAITERIHSCLQGGGRAVGTFDGGRLVGFAAVEGEIFGTKNQYINLNMLHTSYGYRNGGIGRRLFSSICEHAKELKAAKIYISAHAAEDTIAFYRKIGCVAAAEINEKLAEKEPFDCQMEYIL